nr:hypothetical protein [Tanacetum cinerariifolium]
MQSKEDKKEVFTISQERLEQYVTIGATLTTNSKQLLADVVRKNMERMMEKDLVDQRRRNMEIYLEEIVIKSKTISKFISKLAELKHPIREARTRMETTKESSWTNEAEEALQRIKRILSKLQALAVPKEGKDLMLCPRQRNEKISSVLLVERKGIQIPISYVNVVTGGPMEEILKHFGGGRRRAKWAAKIRTYDISYIPRKKAEGLVLEKFFGQGEQVERTPDANDEGTLVLSKDLQEKSTPTPRAWGCI